MGTSYEAPKTASVARLLICLLILECPQCVQCGFMIGGAWKKSRRTG